MEWYWIALIVVAIITIVWLAIKYNWFGILIDFLGSLFDIFD